MIIEIVGMGILSLALGVSLAVASSKLVVKENPKVNEIYEVLPHNNCGACGFPGCLAFAKAVVEDPSLAVHCRVGGNKVVDEMGTILGVKVKHEEPYVSRVLCKGSANCKDKFQYNGVQSCSAAALLSGGHKSCNFSCLGFGDCVNACQFGAIKMNERGLPEIDREKCNACGLCVNACPKNVLALTKKSDSTTVRCRSTDNAKKVVANCKYGCIACGTCVKNCPANAITIQNNLAVIDYSKCTHCGTCAKVCPRKVIEIA